MSTEGTTRVTKDLIHNGVFACIKNHSKQRRDYVYLRSTNPIYLEQRLGLDNHDTDRNVEIQFFKIEYPDSRTKSLPPPTIDTFLVPQYTMMKLVEEGTVRIMDEYASYNDVLSVKMAVVKQFYLELI